MLKTTMDCHSKLVLHSLGNNQYARIMQRPCTNKVREMMEDSSVIRQTFTPMLYVKHQARSLYFTGNFAVEEVHNCTMAEILDDIAVTRLDVVGVGCSAHCSSQMAERVESFINRHKQQSTICFTDAAMSEAEVGISSAAVIILPQDTSVKEMEVSEVIPKITDNTEAEITAIALALKAVSELHRSLTEKVIILSDCTSAITMAIQRPHHSDYHEVIQRLRVVLQELKSLQVAVSVCWIPGHSGIVYNELADSVAKSALEEARRVFCGCFLTGM